MRAQLWRDSLASFGDVEVVMIPIAGFAPPPGTIVPDGDDADGAVALARDSRWRPLLSALDPLPPAAQAAPPWLGRIAAGKIGGRPDVVVAFKVSMGLAALDLAWAVGAPLAVDLDDDEAALMATRDAHRRLRTALGEHAAVMAAASPGDADRISTDLGRVVGVVPNAVAIPAAAPAFAPTDPPTVLFVGNLTYPPNVRGLRWFVRDVLPRVSVDVTVVVVGAGGASALDGLTDPRVRVLGVVAGLAPVYRAASVAICPLLQGSGTRLKILEALSWGRPVVSTSVGAEGLGLRNGEHLFLADDAASFGAVLSDVIGDPARAAAVGRAGRAEVERGHTPAVTRTAIATLLGWT
jgi:glycosyltransferase involved in cell wall biosynthesis